MRPVFDPTGGPDVLVEKMIGQAYATVKRVYCHLPEIKRLDAVLTEIPTLAQTTADNALAAALPPILDQLDEKVQAAEGWAGESEASAEAAAQSALMLGRSIQTVKSVAELRLLSSASPSKSAFVLGHTITMIGGGLYTIDSADMTSPDNNATVIVAADGARWKLKFDTDLDIAQAGALPGQNISGKLNILGEALYSRGGGTIHVSGEYAVGSTVNMYPNVTILGAGQGRGTRLNSTFTGTMFETYRPAGYASKLCIGAKVSRLTLLGKVVDGVKTGTAFSMRNCMQCDISLNEVANFNVGISWNTGSTISLIEESYFNKVYQNMFKPCTIGQYFNGAANRNTFDTNSYADNMVAYNFSDVANYSETNTFITENIEGCRVWAEWGSGTIYSQTWIGICIENPSTNGFVCLVKDPGRQVFLNLSLIPLGNEAAIAMYSLAGAIPSAVFGSAASSGTERLGIRLNEEVRIYDHIRYMANHGSTTFSGTVAANSMTTISITLPSAAINDMVSVEALRNLAGCTLQCWAEPGVVRVNIVNGTAENITIPATEIRAVVSKVG